MPDTPRPSQQPGRSPESQLPQPAPPRARASASAAPGERTLLEGLLHYFSILWQYRGLIIGVTALSAVGVVGFSILSLVMEPERSPLPNVYRASATLILQEGGDQGLSSSMLSALGMDLPGGGGGMNYGDIAIEVLNSRVFTDRIVEANNLIEYYEIDKKPRTNSREAVQVHSTYTFNDRSGILTIAYADIDPEFAAQVADSIVEELQRYFANRGGTDRLQELTTMEEKLEEVEGNITALQAEIEEFQRRHGVLQIEELAQQQSQMLAEFRGQLLQLDLQIKNQAEMSRIENDPALEQLQLQRRNTAELIWQIENGYTGGNEVLPARSQLPNLAARLARMRTDLEIQSRIYEALTEQYEVAKLTAETQPLFSVLEPVEVPEEKAGPSRAQLSITVTLGGFAASVVIAFLINLIRNIANDPEKRRILQQEATGES